MFVTITRGVGDEVGFDGEGVNVGEVCIGKFSPPFCAEGMELEVEELGSSVVGANAPHLV